MSPWELPARGEQSLAPSPCPTSLLCARAPPAVQRSRRYIQHTWVGEGAEPPAPGLARLLQHWVCTAVTAAGGKDPGCCSLASHERLGADTAWAVPLQSVFRASPAVLGEGAAGG